MTQGIGLWQKMSSRPVSRQLSMKNDGESSWSGFQKEAWSFAWVDGSKA